MKNYLGQEEIKYISYSLQEVYELVKEMTVIPAPSNHEEKRAAFVKKYIEDLGYNVEIDAADNVLWKINDSGSNPIVLYTAHTDVVFPDEDSLPFSEDENNMYSPGIGDDTLRLAMLLIAGKYIASNIDRFSEKNIGIIIAANTGEEGLGNLRGIRQLVDDYKDRILEHVTFDGNPDALVTRAVGSHRYSVTINTDGGHSFNAFGNANAIEKISQVVNDIYSIKVPEKENCKTTYNVGLISGGTSVNTIAQSASMLCEYRSDDMESLLYMKKAFDRIFEKQKNNGVNIDVRLIGDRPCGGQLDEAKFDALKKRIMDAEYSSIGIVPKEYSGSTDSNYPLSLGIPSVCAGAGVAHGTHTREEYIEKSSFKDGLSFVLAVLISTFDII